MARRSRRGAVQLVWWAACVLVPRGTLAQPSPSLQTNSAGNVMFDIPSGAEVGMMQQGAYTRFATATDVQSLAAAQISTTASMQTSMSIMAVNMSTLQSQLQSSLVTQSSMAASISTLQNPTAAPTSAPPDGSSFTTAGASCRAIFATRRSLNLPLLSGVYWLARASILGGPFQVYCDMTTPAQDGLSGWTLCGKYDRDRGTTATSRWLTNGFGRSFVNPGDMSTVGHFSGSQKWSSIDCRPLLNRQSMWMMHAGTNDATSMPNVSWSNVNQTNGAVRFTNTLADVKINPTNFFDTARDDIGVCRPRTAGAVTTYNRSWDNLNTIDRGTNNVCSDAAHRCGLGLGACLIGDGHSFCSLRRDGSRFSNAGCTNQAVGGCAANSAPCTGSWGDTVYWAWLSDSHGCSTDLQIGTGCRGSTPTYRYNMLFLY
eukprot:m.457900 g.457900  ORF g.457900 m.457900 type:complete len:429 (-) comp21372_c0_seq1:167-1453(-)